MGDLDLSLLGLEPGKVIWGAGPAFIIPTNTDDRSGLSTSRRRAWDVTLLRCDDGVLSASRFRLTNKK